MLQGFIISGWERCPFATMVSLVLHASSYQFQALQHTAYHGQVLLCALQKAASAGQAYSTLHEWVHVGPSRVHWAAAQVGSSSSAALGKGFSGRCLGKNTVKLCRKTSFPKRNPTRGKSWRIFWNREGCNLSQTFPAPCEESGKSRYLPFCQQHLLAFYISDS